MPEDKSKVYFIFGIHNHQPVGNLPFVFDKAFLNCYLPFLSTLKRFPKIKTVIHNSGALYDWAQIHFPGWIEELQRLVNSSQIELTSGGYFEPVFPIIPQADRLNQIRLLNRYLYNTFGVNPKGCWISERVWEPSLAKTLAECRLDYTYLDQANFKIKAQKQRENSHIYLTEDQGYPLNLFAINPVLPAKIPFIRPEEAIDILLNYRQKKDTLITFFCDGEKFGLWPDTYQLVYQDKWLERFFTLLERNPVIETILPEEAVNKFPKQFTYIKASTYPKMQNWALSYQNNLSRQELVGFLKKENRYLVAKKFIAGEDFKNFFLKYPRLNYMHKRMLWVSQKINSFLNLEEDRPAFLDLWRAQTNCAYWHGIFGGFYLPHLRAACYRYLLQAEAYLDKKEKGQDFLRKDFNFDAYPEVILKESGKTYIFSQLGGSLDEFSLQDKGINLINTFSRVREPYHDQARFDSKLSGHLVYDDYKKTVFLDHTLKKGFLLDDFKKGSGIFSLANKPYKFFKEDSSLGFSYQDKNLSFRKEIKIAENTLKVAYSFGKKNTLNNSGFGIECNLSLSGPENIVFEGPGKGGSIDFSRAQDLGQTSSFTIYDQSYNLRLKFDFSLSLVYLNPVYTLSSSESGPDIIFQQLSFLFVLGESQDNFWLCLESN